MIALQGVLAGALLLVPPAQHDAPKLKPVKKIVKRVSRPAVNIEPYTVTAYTAFCDSGCTGVTATGLDVRHTIYHNGLRIVAVDPTIIPLGSVVTVQVKGQTFRAIAMDTGGAIKGRHIDLLVSSKAEAREFGRQVGSLVIQRKGQ